MGLIASILSFTRERRNDVGVSDVKCDPGGGAIITAEHSAPIGDDSHPLPGDYVALNDTPGTGRQVVAGYFDHSTTPKALPGEKRIYSRTEAGAVAVEVWLKNDGHCVITNSAGVFTLLPSGAFNINGLTITPDGNIITKKGVSLDDHVHAQGADSGGNTETETNPPSA